MSKVKCFACHNIDHYESQCPNKNKEAWVAASASTEIDDFVEKFEKEFSLVSCLLDCASAAFGDIRA
jgi:hypothetical protein